MKQAIHSPGPWKIKETDLGDEECCIVPTHIIAADGFEVVSYDGGLAPDSKWTKDLLVGNAQLIASAPELLQAFKEEHLMGHGADPMKRCEGCELIAKAEGRS